MRPLAPHPWPTALLVLTLALLPTACVGQGSRADASPSTATGPAGTTATAATATPANGRIDTEAVYFSSRAGATSHARAVIRNRDQLDDFARRFGRRAPEITAGASGADFSRVTLVGWSGATGCAQWTSATLRRSGDVLDVRPGPHATPPPECIASFVTVAVFSVPSERMPRHPRFAH
ncbi:hypothetical protein ACQUSR_22260 [Streptomyces sp. P1-3]|uniref:hypothetical protein n=1 Tax=Streptomyces sp. P1-3 TaxID=3421658 RepID=UPI003D36BEC0